MKILFSFFFSLFSTVAVAQSQPSSTDEEPVPAKNESSSSLMWILPTVLALGAGGYAWFVGEAAKRRASQLDKYIKQIGSRQKKSAGSVSAAPPAVAAPVMKDDRAVQDLQKRIVSLEKEVDELRGQVKRQTQPSPARQQKPAATASAPQAATSAKPVAPPQPFSSSIMDTVSKATSTPPAPTYPQTRWAKYADAGDGFSAAALSDAQDGEKIFELTLMDAANARYRVVSAREPQQMALHDPTFYFSKTCTYDTLPTPQSSIATDAPGTLKLVGGKWAIQQPAKIRFS